MMIDINTDSVSVPMITASDIHECEAKNSSMGEKAHSNIVFEETEHTHYSFEGKKQRYKPHHCKDIGGNRQEVLLRR